MVMGVKAGWALAAALAAAAAPGPHAWAEGAPRSLRVLGEAVQPIGAMQPRFVIDAEVTPGEADFQSDVKGWFAALPPGGGSDEVEGACVEARCALTVDVGSDRLALSADLAGPTAPTGGKLTITDAEGRKLGEAPVRLAPITGPVPGLGELAPPGIIGSVELADLLMWNGAPTGFSYSDDEPVGWLERRALAEWQRAHGKSANGLILKEDLSALRREAQRAKAAAAWALLGDAKLGWTAGYPAALLPKVQGDGQHLQFASLDGAAVLTLSVDAPMSDQAFDAFVKRQSEDRPGVENRSYTRVNDDMEITYEEGGRVFSAAYHNRPQGFYRLEFVRPKARAALAPFDTILPRSLRVVDKAP